MKTICLTFDDGVQSHYDVALPLLKKHKLKGTFFITGDPNVWHWHFDSIKKGMEESAMDFSKLHEFVEAGLELGNHSFSHPNFTKLNKDQIINELKDVDRIFLMNGVHPATTFCYPAYDTNDFVAEVLSSCGITHARTGYIYKEDIWADWRLNHPPVMEPKPKPNYYDPKTPLLTRCTGILNCLYGYEYFVEDIERMPEDAKAIFAFHGLKKKNLLEDFENIIKYIVDNNLNTINFRDLK